MDRAQKQESIEALKGVFADAGAVVVTHNLGLTVAEMTDLRLRLRKEGAALKVVKNTLAQKALDGSIGEAGDALFTGPVAIAYASDPVTAAKAIHPARKLAVRVHAHWRPRDLTTRTASKYHTAKTIANTGSIGTGGGNQPSIAPSDGGEVGSTTSPITMPPYIQSHRCA